MQSVDDVRGWWVLRACGRNPLVRGIDRLELVIVAVGILVALAAAACAGALGTAVHDARSRVYIEEAHTRHAVTARTTDESTIVFRVDDDAVMRVNARWRVDGTEHAGSFEWDYVVKTGDPLKIWVDRDGNHVDPPTPTSRAGVEAVGVAYAAWQTVAFAVAGLIWWGRSRLDRLRDSGWEDDIRCLVEDDEGRASRKP
jgi:hypothetical protein